ncbi:MAG: beta-galactosidase [Verrucomicrobia bacterium]|nr:beta-galactosidase [Verrucomicrobiota bacterium]
MAASIARQSHWTAIMYFGADYYPEHWVHPYDGTPQEPEARWKRDARLMVNAGLNVVRMGEFSWGLCEREEGKYDFTWLRRAMDVMAIHGIKVVLGTPTAAPPVWLAQKHPEILPLDENGLRRHEGTRRAYCLNSDIYWEYSKKVVHAMAAVLGDHPNLIAWQIDNGIGRHHTEYSFNPETKRDWHAWLKAKYEDIDRLNNSLGLRFWGQVVSDWKQVPMPMTAPVVHNPALLLDWRRFSSDTCVAFVRMQAEILREMTPQVPVTTSFRAFAANFDYFDMARELDFVSVDSDAAIQNKASEIACNIDLLRSLKKTGMITPDGDQGFWVIEQKAGNVSWADVNSLVRPGVVRLFTYQLLSRGASGVLYFYWRQPRFGHEKFYGGVLTHDGRGDNRMYEEVCQIGQEIKRIAPVLHNSRVKAEVCILVSHANDWALNQAMRPNKFFDQREHLQLFYAALHKRNVPVDFARPEDNLAAYKLVIAPSLHLLAGGEADRLKLYVHTGGTLISTFNTGLVDEHNTVPATGYPYDLTDLFGLKVLEFDPLPPGEENNLMFQGAFPASANHPARIWCDLIEPKDCQILATYTRDFYAGRPAFTRNRFGDGRAIYVGTMSTPAFYDDLTGWALEQCGVKPLLEVPEHIEVHAREKDGRKIYFLLNHHHAAIRVNLNKPLVDLFTGEKAGGSLDLQPHGVAVLHEQAAVS